MFLAVQISYLKFSNRDQELLSHVNSISYFPRYFMVAHNRMDFNLMQRIPQKMTYLKKLLLFFKLNHVIG